MNERVVPYVYRELLKKIRFYIYGNGQIAEEVYQELCKNDAIDNVLGVIISEKYWVPDLCFHGLKVYKYEGKKEHFDNVLLAYDVMKYADLTSSLIRDSNIQKIYIWSSLNMFLYNKWIGFSSEKCVYIDNYYKIAQKRGLNSEYYNNNITLFNETKGMLCDEKSRNVMDCYISGHIEQNNYPMLKVWRLSDVNNQYFPDCLQFTQNEVVVDCGAYTGDTFKSYLYHGNGFAKYYAFEPDKKVVPELKRQIMLFPTAEIIEKGVSNFEGTIGFDTSNGCGTIANSSECCIRVTTIDKEIEGDISFVKMDIEGAELDALKGAKNKIVKYKPKLAICVYHKKEDLITIPQFIKSMRGDYKLYLRAHEPTLSEVVLYAI